MSVVRGTEVPPSKQYREGVLPVGMNTDLRMLLFSSSSSFSMARHENGSMKKRPGPAQPNDIPEGCSWANGAKEAVQKRERKATTREVHTGIEENSFSLSPFLLSSSFPFFLSFRLSCYIHTLSQQGQPPLFRTI